MMGLAGAIGAVARAIDPGVDHWLRSPKALNQWIAAEDAEDYLINGLAWAIVRSGSVLGSEYSTLN